MTIRKRMVLPLALALGALGMMVMATAASATHPRPVGASPLRASLVPAYNACGAPNRTHGPPLAFASCNPPAQTSAQATVGTPDANGGAANSTGSLRLTAWRGAPAAVDPVDILIDVALNDVRCAPTSARCGTANASGPPDYSGEMRFSFTFRVTDHWNASTPGGGTDPATVQDFATDFAWACVQSGSTSTGSTCNLNTSLNAINPLEPVKDGKRAIHELSAVRIYDGGADGDGDTAADNTVFARPGIFIP
jgi:hypothetical protein